MRRLNGGALFRVEVLKGMWYHRRIRTTLVKEWSSRGSLWVALFLTLSLGVIGTVSIRNAGAVEGVGILGGPDKSMVFGRPDPIISSSLQAHTWDESMGGSIVGIDINVDSINDDGVADLSPSPFLVKPAQGFNWGKLHANNAVDIANTCGTKVVSAADGLVVPATLCDGDVGWNGGYGTCVAIEHLGNIKTRYAHLQSISVTIGEYVAQGQEIGEMGSTGESTGCHLHFEVEGIRNPFVKL